MVKRLAQKYSGIACEENYHNSLLSRLDGNEFPFLTYTRNLWDWHDFVRLTLDKYEAWIKGVSKECAVLELLILENMDTEGKPVFVDTNSSIETLHKISDYSHVLIILADPDISVNRFSHSGFRVILRDEGRSIEDTLAFVERAFGLQK